jgi:hypothetical protein
MAEAPAASGGTASTALREATCRCSGEAAREEEDGARARFWEEEDAVFSRRPALSWPSEAAPCSADAAEDVVEAEACADASLATRASSAMGGGIMLAGRGGMAGLSRGAKQGRCMGVCGAWRAQGGLDETADADEEAEEGKTGAEAAGPSWLKMADRGIARNEDGELVPARAAAAWAVACERLPKPRLRSAAMRVACSSCSCCCHDHFMEARALDGMAAGSLASAFSLSATRSGAARAARRAGVASRSGRLPAARQGDGGDAALCAPDEDDAEAA